MDEQGISLLLFLREQLLQRDIWTRQQLEKHQYHIMNVLRVYTYAHELCVLLSDGPAAFIDETLIRTLRQELATQRIIVPPLTMQRVTTISRIANGKIALITSTA